MKVNFLLLPKVLMTEESEPFLKFEPIYQTRVWGGRTLESQFGRQLPDTESPFGESWEISAREEADCVVSNGPLRGKSLTSIWQSPETRREIFGPSAPDQERFPLLCKILDARSKLSIQVHPPADLAGELGGEPKSEAWYIADADPDAKLYVGVRKGVTKTSFREAMENGTLEEQVHAISVKAGDYIYIPSGRLHAIGAGVLIYEIQQNSDTTFRVFDWNRVGLDGKPRDLHIEESMKCIDFDDSEPGMDQAVGNVLCECDHFRMEKHTLSAEVGLNQALGKRFGIVTVVSGALGIGDDTFEEGSFFLVPHDVDAGGFTGTAEVILTLWPE